MQVKGVEDINGCIEAWEKIVEATSKETNNFKFLNYKSALVGYNILLADYNAIKACISVLYFGVEQEELEYLRVRRYKINTEGSLEDYQKSLELAELKSNSLITRLKLKMSEMEKAGEVKQESDAPNFDSIMSELIAKNIHVDDNITLSRYNALTKVLNRKTDG